MTTFTNDNARAALYAAQDAGLDPVALRALRDHCDDSEAALEILEVNGFIKQPRQDEAIQDAPNRSTFASVPDLDASIGELHEHLLRLTEERPVPQEVVGTSSGDERISLTLVGGRATGLTIDARAMRQTNVELAEEILEAINAALTAQSDGDGERVMSRVAGLGEVLERSRRAAEEQLAQVQQGLRDTVAARTETTRGTDTATIGDLRTGVLSAR